jgi:hypothetical protein
MLARGIVLQRDAITVGQDVPAPDALVFAPFNERV